jgi:hypothetical protein
MKKEGFSALSNEDKNRINLFLSPAAVWYNEAAKAFSERS